MDTRNLKAKKLKTVTGAVEAKFYLVSYVDDSGREFTQPALVGSKKTVLLNAVVFGFGKVATPTGEANAWLNTAIREFTGLDNVEGPEVKTGVAKNANGTKS